MINFIMRPDIKIKNAVIIVKENKFYAIVIINRIRPFSSVFPA